MKNFIPIMLLFAIFLIANNPVIAQETLEPSAPPPSVVAQDDKLFVYETLSEQRKETNAEIKNLRDLISDQNEVIRDLQIELKSQSNKPITNGITFEVWSSILLGSVAVLVTVLGVGVALLSFIGYRELIEKGTEKASLVAAKQTEVQFQRFIQQGKLDAVIAEGINRVAYRGISSGDKDDDTEEDENNNDVSGA